MRRMRGRFGRRCISFFVEGGVVEEGGSGWILSVDYVWVVSVGVDVESAYCLGKVRIRKRKEQRGDIMGLSIGNGWVCRI